MSAAHAARSPQVHDTQLLILTEPTFPYIERKNLHMRKIAESSYTGSDRILFYDIGEASGDVRHSHIRIVHLQEWSDLVGKIEAEDMEKYNVVTRDVCVSGYDNYVHGPDTYEAKHDMQPKEGVGHSVHASLRSCGFVLTSTPLNGMPAHVRITNEHDGELVTQGELHSRTVALVIAEAMYDYGAGDRVHDESGNNARELLKSARSA